MINEYNILVEKPEGKSQLGRPGRRCQDVRTELREADWIHLAQYRNQWRATVNTIMNLGIP
jgi:hypothetical protein